MKYRPEIDGLRAAAVVPVILFHAGLDVCTGGFVGVDVFFVISGYLITTIILAELDAGTFSFSGFYERRARRILPALFLVIAACIPFAWMWLLPGDMKRFALSLLAVTSFSSNVLFWQESGYFDTSSELKPLLHTWSLAVEEQYYLLFPLFMVFAWRWGKGRLAAMLAAGGFLSFAVAQWGTVHAPAAAFYLLPTRGWELLVGSLVAFRMARPGRVEGGTLSANVASLAGLGAIGYAVFAFDRQTPFPGAWALLPTLGAAAVIAFGTRRTLVGAVLGSRIPVGIGLISYSAYLWHQPLFVFARHRSLDPPGQALFAALAALAFVLAYASWRFVEQPFRKRERIGRRPLVSLAAAASVVAMVGGVAGYASNGYYGRAELEASLGDVEQRLQLNYGLDARCEGFFSVAAECRTSDEPEFLLWGDSYAMHLMQGMLSSRKELGIAQMTISMCGPFFGVAPAHEPLPPEWITTCIAENDKVLEWLKQHKSVKYAVLGSPFEQYVSDRAKIQLRSGEVVSGKAEAIRHFEKTLETLQEIGVTPVVFSPTPQNGKDIGRCAAKAVKLGLSQDVCSFDRKIAEQRQRNVIEFLRKVDVKYKVAWLFDAICDGGTCRSMIDNVFIYRDNGHLSHEGSAYLGAKLGFYDFAVSGK